MSRSTMTRALAAAGVLALHGPVSAQPSFTLLPWPVVGEPFLVRGLSANGAVAVGQSSVSIPWVPNAQPGYWNGASGILEDLVPTSPISYGIAYAASADGRFIVGRCMAGGGNRAVLWDGGIPHELPRLPGIPFDGTTARSVSANGSVAVGTSFMDGTRYDAIRWQDRVPTRLPGVAGYSYHDATGVSADGSTVVGHSFVDTFNPMYGGSAWIWSGSTTTLLELPVEATGVWTDGISADGSTVYGQINVGSPQGSERFKATAWRNGSPHVLDQPVGARNTWAMSSTPDGATIIGEVETGVFQGFACTWEEGSGIGNLNLIAASLGLDLNGWTMRRATGISADGTVIVGQATKPGMPTASWILVIPSPTTATVLVLGGAAVGCRTRRTRSSRVTTAGYSAPSASCPSSRFLKSAAHPSRPTRAGIDRRPPR
jgi:uncharacterized membrane protein